MPSDCDSASDSLPSPALRGDAALAVGALAAGVMVVTGYPGSPATGVFDQILARTTPGAVQLHWAPNEKVGMELAMGASLAGSRALLVLKSVGLNVALDPLATMSLAGCHAGLVILLGDDPGGMGSQNEQDSRWLARVAEVPVVEPLDVEQSAALMAQAFVWSETLGLPIILRITPALMSSYGAVEEPWRLPPSKKRFWRRRNRWVMLPAWVVKSRRRLHRHLREMRQMLELSPYDRTRGDGRLGVLAVGSIYQKLESMLPDGAPATSVFGLSSVWPLPESTLSCWLQRLNRVLVLEEGGPFVEYPLRALVQRHGLKLAVLGREDGAVSAEGELNTEELAASLSVLDARIQAAKHTSAARAMPSKVPLCVDCPYRPAFETLVDVMDRHGGREAHIVVGETGCMVRANLKPLELFDVKYGLGSGLGLALGLAMADRSHRIVALLGDSSFFHTDINAVPFAAQLGLPMLVAVLDNGVTALTGGQPHPGSSADERGLPRALPADIAGLIRACGAEVTLCPAKDRAALRRAFEEGLLADGPRFVVVQGPCPRYIAGG